MNAETEYYSVAEREDLDGNVTADIYLSLRSQQGTWDANL